MPDPICKMCLQPVTLTNCAFMNCKGADGVLLKHGPPPPLGKGEPFCKKCVEAFQRYSFGKQCPLCMMDATLISQSEFSGVPGTFKENNNWWWTSPNGTKELNLPSRPPRLPLPAVQSRYSPASPYSMATILAIPSDWAAVEMARNVSATFSGAVTLTEGVTYQTLPRGELHVQGLQLRMKNIHFHSNVSVIPPPGRWTSEVRLNLKHRTRWHGFLFMGAGLFHDTDGNAYEIKEPGLYEHDKSQSGGQPLR